MSEFVLDTFHQGSDRVQNFDRIEGCYETCILITAQRCLPLNRINCWVYGPRMRRPTEFLPPGVQPQPLRRRMSPPEASSHPGKVDQRGLCGYAYLDLNEANARAFGPCSGGGWVKSWCWGLRMGRAWIGRALRLQWTEGATLGGGRSLRGEKERLRIWRRKGLIYKTTRGFMNNIGSRLLIAIQIRGLYIK